MVIWHRLRVASLAGLLVAGCASASAGESAAATTAASVKGHAPAPAPRPRAFVSPYSYEWFIRAELLLARGSHAQAAEAYRAALASADDDPYLLARLAEALDRAGSPKSAVETLDAALARDPHSEAVWLARARIAVRAGATPQAIEAYERAEAAAPASATAPFALAALLAGQGNPERAAAVLERFAARAGDGAAPALRAKLELARTRGDHAALVHAARRWLDHAAREPATMRELARELLASGDAALAGRILAALPEGGADDAALRLDVHLALRADAAVEALLATTSAADLGGLLRVAEAYVQIGQPERALTALSEQSAAEEPEPHRRALVRAQALLATGEFAAAADAAAAIPERSAYRKAALDAVQSALRAQGLPELAREVAASTR